MVYHPDPEPTQAEGLHSLMWVSAPPPVLVLLIHVDRGRCTVHRELGVVHLRRGVVTGMSTVLTSSACLGSVVQSECEALPTFPQKLRKVPHPEPSPPS